MSADYFKFAADNARREFARQHEWVIIRPDRLEVRGPDRDGEFNIEMTSNGETERIWLTPAEAKALAEVLLRDTPYAAYLKGEQPDPRD